MLPIPIYKALISEDYDGITCISLVEEGAVEIDFQMYAKDREKLQQFAIQDEEQHLLMGCIMRADFDIYRRNGDYEYYIRYDAETCAKMATKMLRDNAFSQIDLQHNGEMLPKGVVEMRELFIKDTSRGIAPEGFEDCKDGSLFAVYKVNSEELWEMCKQGVFNSFSLEGYFTTEEVRLQKQDKKDITMKIKSILKKMLEQFSSIVTDKAELFYEGDEIEVGVEVADENGNAIEDGEYATEDKVIVVADGKVVEIREKEEEVADEEPAEVEEPVEAEETVEEEVVVEETPAEPETDALRAEIEKLRSELDALRAEIEAIKEKLAEPAVEPVAEEFEKITEKKSTGNKKLDRAVEIARALNR